MLSERLFLMYLQKSINQYQVTQAAKVDLDRKCLLSVNCLRPFYLVLLNLSHLSLNGVLRRFQQYFSCITATAHIIHVFPGFHQYYAGALKCLAQGHSQENPGDPVRLEPKTPGLLVKHLTTEPRRTQNLSQTSSGFYKVLCAAQAI